MKRSILLLPLPILILLTTASFAAVAASGFQEQIAREFPLNSPPQGRESPFNVYRYPVVISDSDHQQMLKAANQRARAAQFFLRTLYENPDSLQSLIPNDLLTQIRQRRPHRLFDPTRIHFILGIDVLRHSDGSLRIIEDNYSVTSGLWTADWISGLARGSVSAGEGNISAIREFSRALIGLQDSTSQPQIVNIQYDLYTPVRRMDVYADLFMRSQELIRQVNISAGIRTLHLGPLESLSLWSEANFGFGISGNHGINPATGAQESIRVEGRDVWLREYIGSETHTQPVQVLWPHITTAHLLEYLPGIVRALSASRIELLQSPGIEVLDNKLLQSYFDGIIRNVLGEEPAIPFARTLRFIGDDQIFSEAVFTHILETPQNWIIKPTGLQGGEGIVFALDLPRNTSLRTRLREQITANPGGFVAQEIVVSSNIAAAAFEREPRKIDFRAFAIAGSVPDNSAATGKQRQDRVRSLPNISSRSVPLSAKTHNVTTNPALVAMQMVMPEQRYLLAQCERRARGVRNYE